MTICIIISFRAIGDFMNINLKGKVIVVTGSSRGLGREMILEFAREDAKVVINYCHNQQYAMELHRQIQKYNQDCIVIQADVTQKVDVERLYKKVIDRFGRIDILVNNAGKCSDNFIQFMDYEQWSAVMTTNLDSIYWCTRIFSKKMISQRKGKIINIASLKGQLGSEGQCNYAASKAGVIGLTKSLAKEMGSFGISVNAVCPGFIRTDLNKENPNKVEIAERMSALENEKCLQDFLAFMVVMCSDLMTNVSGRVFNLDSRIF